MDSFNANGLSYTFDIKKDADVPLPPPLTTEEN